MSRPRRGFALLTVLWAIAGAAALALAVRLVSLEQQAETTNQIAELRAYWASEGCASTAVSAIQAALLAAPPDSLGERWRDLDRVLAPGDATYGPATCSESLESAGDRLNINAASEADLAALLSAAGVARPKRDSLVSALLDWRDEDDLPRAVGAEREWYRRQHLSEPRNAPFRATEEWLRVRGADALSPAQVSSITRALGVDSEPIDLRHASELVVSSLPGSSPLAAGLIASLRRQSWAGWDLAHLIGQLPASVADSLRAHYRGFSRVTSLGPTHWLLVSTGRAGAPQISERLELLLAISGSHLSVIRHRVRLE